jgi:WD40-like Beta Propeller Repeat
MGRLVAIAVCVLAGCYSARAFPGAPCTSEGACPSGLACVAGLCELPGNGGGDDTDAPTTPGHDGAEAIDAAPDAEGPAGPNGWHAATHVPGVNTSSTETDPCFANNDLTIVFASDRAGGTGGIDLYIGTRANTTQPFTVRELSELDSTAADSSPEISADGLTIYFSTTRNGTAQIYTATRAATTDLFGAPAENTALSKSHAGLTDSTSIGVGSTTVAIVVFASGNSNEPDGYEYVSSVWKDEEDLDSANGGPLPSDFTAPSMTPDTTMIYYQSGSPGQVYMVTYDESSDTFGTPVNIGELNLGTRDAAPEISADGAHLVFERDGDLFEASK